MMMYKETTKVIPLGDDREITISTGKLAKQADGAVVVKQGDTMLLATVVAAKDAKPDVDFMPLSVEYKEKYAAAGRYPGGFLKREARPSDSEILIARLIDRALRPLFPADYHAEVFVTVNLISEGHSAGCARGPRRIGGARRIGYSLRRSHFGGARIAYRR